MGFSSTADTLRREEEREEWEGSGAPDWEETSEAADEGLTWRRLREEVLRRWKSGPAGSTGRGGAR
jgi:hypothetical protein